MDISTLMEIQKRELDKLIKADAKLKEIEVQRQKLELQKRELEIEILKIEVKKHNPVWRSALPDI